MTQVTFTLKWHIQLYYMKLILMPFFLSPAIAVRDEAGDMVFTTVGPSVCPSVRPSVRPSVDGHLVRAISQQRLELWHFIFGIQTHLHEGLC